MGQFEKYEDLPTEWKNEKFLQTKINESIKLRNTFTCLAALGWSVTLAVPSRPESTEDFQNMHTAAVVGAGMSTGLAILGTVAIVKLKKFLHQAKTENNNAPRPKI